MTIRQLIHEGPAKANELIARLLGTGDGAVKTRERLFAELKAELELLAGLEEKHLFPVLRKHDETKQLAADALADSKRVRALLAELDAMPKDGEAFANKVGELKQAFQQHVRDEKRELLPAVSQALSREEAETVVERIEAGTAAVEEAKREEAERQRAEARQERERAEAEEAKRREAEAKRQEAERRRAEDARRQEEEQRAAQARQERDAAERRKAEEEAERRAEEERRAAAQREQAKREAAERRSREIAAATTQATETTVGSGLRVVETAVTSGAETAVRDLRRTAAAAGRVTADTAGAAAEAARLYRGTAAEVLEAERDLASFWLELASEQVKQNVETVSRLVAVRGWQDAVEVQRALVRDSFERMGRLNRRYLETVQQVLRAAARPGRDHRAA